MAPRPIAPSAAPELLLLLRECRRRGIRVSSDGVGLRLSGPGAAVTTRLREGLRTHRATLVALLGGAGGRPLPDRPDPDGGEDLVREPIPGPDDRSSSAQVVVPSRELDKPWQSPGPRFPDLPDFPDEIKRRLARQESVPPSDPPRRAPSPPPPRQEQPAVAGDPGNPGASPLVSDTSGLSRSRPPRGAAGTPRWVPGAPVHLPEEHPPEEPGWSVAPAAAPRVANRLDSEESRRGARAVRPASWRATVAGWSIPWRQRWGDRANALQEAGLTGPDAEHRAFNEVVLLRAATPEDDPEEDEGPGRTAAGSRPRPPGRPAPERGRSLGGRGDAGISERGKPRTPRADGHDIDWDTRTCKRCGKADDDVVKQLRLRYGDPEPAKSVRQRLNTSRGEEACYSLTPDGRALAERGFPDAQKYAVDFARRHGLNIEDGKGAADDARVPCCALSRPDDMEWIPFLPFALPQLINSWYRQ